MRIIIAVLIFNGVIIVLFLCKYLHFSIMEYRQKKKDKVKDAMIEKMADNDL